MYIHDSMLVVLSLPVKFLPHRNQTLVVIHQSWLAFEMAFIVNYTRLGAGVIMHHL